MYSVGSANTFKIFETHYLFNLETYVFEFMLKDHFKSLNIKNTKTT